MCGAVKGKRLYYKKIKGTFLLWGYIRMYEKQYTLDLLTVKNRKLSCSEKMYRLIAGTSSDAILYYSYEDELLKTVGNWDAFFDFRIESLSDLNQILDMVDSPFGAGLRELLFEEEVSHKSLLCSFYDEEKWFEFSLDRPMDEEGRPEAKIIRIKDMTKEHEKERSLAHLAYYSSATGLYNKVHFVGRLGAYVRRASEQHDTVAVLMIDIDNFKRVNDGIGIVYGDELIQVLSGYIRDVLGENMIAAHFGEDLFCMAIYNPCGSQSVEAVYHSLRERLHNPIVLTNGRKVRITLSVGVAQYPESANNTLDLINNAEIVMYKVKRLGRDNIRYYDLGDREEFEKQIEMEYMLNEALGRGGYELFYQPQFYSSNRRLRGFEALIRMRDKNGVLHYPGEFIKYAELNGLMSDIGTWVIYDSFKTFSEWKKKYDYPLILSINISVPQFQDIDFVDKLLGISREFGIVPSQIELEVTESILIEDTEKVLDRLHYVKELGFGISLDDFGTGFSSLSYLQKLPVSTLKIDKSFTDLIESENTTRVLTETIVYLARRLGYETIAEGVENEKQYEIIREMGCDSVQGYLLSRPITKEAMEELIRQEI